MRQQGNPGTGFSRKPLLKFPDAPTILACAALLLTAHAGAATVCFQTDFDSSNALAGWKGSFRLEPGKSGNAAAVETAGAGRTATFSRPLPVEGLRGCTIRASASVKARDVSARPNPWNGIKYMLVIQAPDGTGYPQAQIDTGTLDWTQVAFSTRIPSDATNLTLVLGLEQVAGKVWFDDLRIAITRPPPGPPPSPFAGPAFKGHPFPRLRGTMISPSINADGLRVLGQDWNANLLRWQLIRFGRPGQARSLEDYDAWLETELRKLDAALPSCEKFGLLVVVDLHSPPGGKPTSSGYIGSDDRLFTDKASQDRFVQTWRQIAARYKNSRNVWAYDLANEPVEGDIAEGCDDWQALAERAARAIREVDPSKAIIVEPSEWGGPDGFKHLVPIGVSNVVYSAHMYIPHAFTHQRLNGQGPAWNYPGEIQSQHWSKAELERALQPVVDFQKRFNTHIYIGEFSAIRWAPDNSALRYLTDLIDIFESHGWDWSYHAFREWQGWSVEHGPDRENIRPASSPTERERLLRGWFAKNQKPPPASPGSR